MLNWVSQYVRNNSIGEWAFKTNSRWISIPILYYFNKGRLVFTPLTMQTDFAIDSSSDMFVSIINSIQIRYQISLNGNLETDLTEFDYDKAFVQLIETNPKTENFIKSKTQYLSKYLDKIIFVFKPEKINSWDLETDESEEIEVHIP